MSSDEDAFSYEKNQDSKCDTILTNNLYFIFKLHIVRRGDVLIKSKHLKIIIKSIVFTFGIFLLGLIGYLAIDMYFFDELTGVLKGKYRDRVVYLLEKVDENDDSSYMLAKWCIHYEKYEVVTDSQSIKDNKTIFKYYNSGKIYGTTADCVIHLLKDGTSIDYDLFDDHFTSDIEYGTIQFKRVNQLQYSLHLGASIIEEGKNYSIVSLEENGEEYYSFFVHGEDLHSLETVYYITGDKLDRKKIEKPVEISKGVLEFVYWDYRDVEYHCYFRGSDNKLSKCLQVKARKDNLILYEGFSGAYNKIVIHDIFDKDIGYQVLTGIYPKPQSRMFLLSAYFVSDSEVFIEYIGEDELVHEGIFSLKKWFTTD